MMTAPRGAAIGDRIEEQQRGLPLLSRPGPEKQDHLDALSALPAGFDPRDFPIISKHWYGISPEAARPGGVA